MQTVPGSLVLLLDAIRLDAWLRLRLCIAGGTHAPFVSVGPLRSSPPTFTTCGVNLLPSSVDLPVPRGYYETMNHTRRDYAIIRNPERRLRLLRLAARYLIDRTGITDESVADVTTRLARRGLATTDSLVDEYASAVRAAEGLEDGSIPVEDYLGGERYYAPRELLTNAIADDQRILARRIERRIAGA